MNKYLLLTVSGLVLLAGPASAQGYASRPEPLQPRIEAGAKAGTERSMGTMEGWMPLVQDDDSVLYGDIRWMADDEENQEGNLGIGYRVMQGDHIIGAHGWIDRRRTDRGSTFYQVTGGVEFLKEDWDVKANAYVPMNKEKEYATANIGQSSPYMAGTGLFVDTNGTIIEEAQPGGDIEVGYRLPILEKHIDAVRVYGGGYAFIGDVSDDTVGGRVRASVDINPLINVGARFQYDEPRGSQGFIEATLRFPFTAKKRFQQHGLRARLDESPERDIDIVTGAQVDTGLRKEVVNVESGQIQRVIHVDNSAANGGNGSKENPYNTLAAAQAAMLDNDVIYVHRGNGTSSGMNQGIVINKNNVQLIGSGTDFIFDTDRFTTRRPGQKPADGTVIVAGGLAPVITNTTVPVDLNDHMTGNGVLVTGDKALVAGIAVNGAQHNGIAVIANGAGAHITDTTVMDVTSTANARRGILAYAINGGIIDNVTFSDSTSNGNLTTFSNGRGIEVRAEGAGSRIENALLRGNTANSNTSSNIQVFASGNGYVGTAVLEDNDTTSGLNVGIVGQVTTNGIIDNLTVRGNTVQQSGIHGIFVQSQTGGVFNDVVIEDNNVSTSTQHGIYVAETATGAVHNVTIQDNTSRDSGWSGITIASFLNVDAVISGNQVFNNAQNGIHLFNQGTGSLTASLDHNTMTNNGSSSVNPNFYYGIRVDNDGTGTFNADLGGGSLGSTGGNRIYNNFYRDVFVDSRPGTAAATPGTTIFAQDNWWGVNTGLNQGTRVTFDNGSASPGSSIDASNFLTTDPGI